MGGFAYMLKYPKKCKFGLQFTDNFADFNIRENCAQLYMGLILDSMVSYGKF